MKPVQVECKNIELAYGATQVLKGITLTIAPGEFFALLGPSGSGKSTLLRLIAGFNFAQSGQLMVDGADITRVPPWQRNIGMVFQNYALWPHMTVEKNVAFGLEERKLPRAEIVRKVKDVLALVGLTDFAQRRPNQLSGGQQQRVALARTLAVEPKVLLLDEPLSNLDAKLRVQMRQELKSLQRRLGITTIFVTHDQEEALTTCDRIAVMDQGVIQQIGTPMELYDLPVNRFVANFVGTINFIEGEIEHAQSGSTFSSTLLGKISLPETTLDHSSKRVALALRPHTIRISADNAAPADATSHNINVPGNILEREFLGEFVRYRIDANGTELIVDQSHQPGSEIFATGRNVTLGISAHALRLVA
ncbi:MAG: ABC transporter ATP-binding protein [Burkholderiales bacterium]|nr:ABC transporter ATP-binding protein [Burkholderiales bacterium]